MDKQRLIKYCRYYKGERANPFKDSRSSLWEIERIWVKMVNSASPLLDEYIEETRFPILSLAKIKDMPPSMVALLLDRYTHFGGTADGFLVWLDRNYPKSN